MADELKQQVLDYLKTHNTMTLATCAGDVPWAATVFSPATIESLFFFVARFAPLSKPGRQLTGCGDDSGGL